MGQPNSSALAAIYDAALSDEHWPRALQHVASEVSSLGAILIAVDQVGLPFHIEQSSYPMEQVRYYFEKYGQYDEPVMSRTLAATPPLQLLRDCDVWGDVSALDDRPDYRWLRENIGARRRAGVRLSANKGWVDLLTLQFDREWDPSPSVVQARLDLVLPHLAKVVEINRKFTILRTQYQAVLAALDHVRVGTCILGPTGHVVVSNREAQRIFSLGDGLSLSRIGFLAGSTSELTAELADKVRSVASTARGEGWDHEVIVFADRKSGARPFLIEIAPLRDSVGELERGLAGALVFIVDPENTHTISTERLSLLFTLTDAEAEVCRYMIGGHSALEIADVRDVSEGTIKSQFKAIYAKTGVHRRADLLRLALSVDPPIERAGAR